MMTEPLYPEQIDALKGVKASFQTDRSLQSIYESAPRATDLASLTAVGLKFADSLARSSGQGTLDRLVVSSDHERLMIFALNPKSGAEGQSKGGRLENGTGPRLFGVLVDASQHVDEVAEKIGKIVEPE